MIELARLLNYKVGIAAAGLAFVALIWQWFDADGLPEGFARANGRIEAVEIDISTRSPGRIKEILIREGQFVRTGDVLARMDTGAC